MDSATKILIIGVALSFSPVIIEAIREWKRTRREHVFSMDKLRKVVLASPPHIAAPKKTQTGRGHYVKAEGGVHYSEADRTEAEARAPFGEAEDASVRDAAYGWQDFRRASEMAQQGAPLRFRIEQGT